MVELLQVVYLLIGLVLLFDLSIVALCLIGRMVPEDTPTSVDERCEHGFDGPCGVCDYRNGHSPTPDASDDSQATER